MAKAVFTIKVKFLTFLKNCQTIRVKQLYIQTLKSTPNCYKSPNLFTLQCQARRSTSVKVHKEPRLSPLRLQLSMCLHPFTMVKKTAIGPPWPSGSVCT